MWWSSYALEARWKFPDKLSVLFEPHRYKVFHGGRGAAKSWGVARALLIRGWQEPLRVLCARETQKSIAESVHQLLKDQIGNLGLDHFYAVQESTIFAANGTQFTFAGIRQQTVTSIKSYEGVDVCWVEEAQVVTKRSWGTLIPTIRKPGSEIIITFNPDLDTDETYQRFVVDPPADAAVVNINYRDNPWFPDVLEKERLDLLKRDPEEYENVWEGKPRSVVPGAIYRKELLKVMEEQRVRNVPYDPMLKVHTVWDLGFVRMPITLVQRQGSELRIIEYLENEASDYGQAVAELNKRPYNWGYDWLPHDADSHSPHTGKTPAEIVKALGRKVRVIQRDDVEAGIKAARMIFPRCYFDREKAIGLVNRLKRYRRVIHATTNEPGPPLHDENSDGSDTFRYLAAVADQLTNSDVNTKPIVYPNQGIV